MRHARWAMLLQPLVSTDTSHVFTNQFTNASAQFAKRWCGEQLAAKLEDTLGLPPTAAGLSILVAALIGLDQFNGLLGKDVLNNPSNSLAFAMAGRGDLSAHLARIVSPHLCPPHCDYPLSYSCA